MKKWGILVLIGLVLAAGCGEKSGDTVRDRGAKQSVGVKDILEQRLEESAVGSEKDAEVAGGETAKAAEPMGTKPVETAESPETKQKETIESAEANQEEAVDVDLTAISGTMVYSEVYDMMTAPDKYIGKTVKMQGSFSVYQDPSTGQYYFACVIQDATACCAQGLEFMLTEEYEYPIDYPKEGEEITVEGVFDTYMEGTYQYCTLRGAKLL